MESTDRRGGERREDEMIKRGHERGKDKRKEKLKERRREKPAEETQGKLCSICRALLSH